MSRFQVGQTYTTRSICDHDCIFKVTILARTAKTVTILNWGKKNPERRGIRLWNGIEQFDLFGRYSMAPIIGADEKIAE